MWTRIALLQQLSRKEIQIGIHFPSSGCFPLLSKNRRAILSDINAAAEGIVSYWHSKDWSSPRFTVVVEQAFPLAYDEGLERLLGSWGIGIEYHSAESISEMWATGSLGEVFEE
jgi:hypothetical protein